MFWTVSAMWQSACEVGQFRAGRYSHDPQTFCEESEDAGFVNRILGAEMNPLRNVGIRGADHRTQPRKSAVGENV